MTVEERVPGETPRPQVYGGWDVHSSPGACYATRDGEKRIEALNEEELRRKIDTANIRRLA